MPPFFAEYSDMLVIAMSIVGFVLGLLVGYFFWGSYGRQSKIAEQEIVELEENIDGLQAAHRHMKNELAARA